MLHDSYILRICHIMNVHSLAWYKTCDKTLNTCSHCDTVIALILKSSTANTCLNDRDKIRI